MKSLVSPLSPVLQVPGVVGVVVVDADSRSLRDQAGIVSREMEDAAVDDTSGLLKMLRAANARAPDALAPDATDGAPRSVTDALITRGKQRYILYPLMVQGVASLFLYVALAGSVANVELCRSVIGEAASALML